MLTGCPLAMVPFDVFFFILLLSDVVLDYCTVNALDFMGSKTEDWGSNRVDYIHVYWSTARLHKIFTYIGLTSHQLHLVSLTYIFFYISNISLTSLCVHTLLPKVLTFICILTSLWFVSWYCEMASGAVCGCMILHLNLYTFHISHDSVS